MPRPLLYLRNVVLALMVALFLAGCSKTQLYTGLTEREANEMIATLMAKGISASKAPGEEGVYSISVDQSRFSEAVDILKVHGYPRDTFTNLGEAFKKSGMVSSPGEDKIRFMYALSQGLSETLSHIDGVLTARVHIVLPENDPLTDKFYPSSAAVFIKYRPDSAVEALQPQIKTMVADSIEGLKYNQVTLVLVPAENLAIPEAVLPKDYTERNIWVGVAVVLVLGAFGLMVFAVWQRMRPPGGTSTMVETARTPATTIVATK